MDRCAIFVDAGYVLAEGGRICLRTSSRAAFRCDFPSLVGALDQFAKAHSGGLDRLRMYWYDGAPRGIPTADHERIGGLAYVKVRLGRITHGEQKGVDALIYRDLMTLARERAIARAYLVSGDEDLREGVVAAQDMGVQVVLVGIPTRQRANQSASLIREADEHVVLPVDFWRGYFSSLEAQQPAEPRGGPTEAQTAGRSFAVGWLHDATQDQVDALLAGSPVIPKELDIQLILEAEKTLGSLRDRQELKREVRAGFWGAVETPAGSPVD